MYRKIRCDVRQWKILGTFRGTKHSLCFKYSTRCLHNFISPQNVRYAPQEYQSRLGCDSVMLHWIAVLVSLWLVWYTWYTEVDCKLTTSVYCVFVRVFIHFFFNIIPSFLLYLALLLIQEKICESGSAGSRKAFTGERGSVWVGGGKYIYIHFHWNMSLVSHIHLEPRKEQVQ